MSITPPRYEGRVPVQDGRVPQGHRRLVPVLDISEVVASRLAPARASGKESGSSTRRIPLPPPPARALMSTG